MNQLKIGAVLSYISIFLTFAVGLIYTPILVRMLGQTDYGIYSLVIALGTYLTLLDMGLGNAIIRYIARNRELGSNKLESDLIGQFLKFFFIIGVLTILAGTIMIYNVDNLFSGNFSSDSIETIKIMLIILTLNYAFSFPLNVYSAVAQAYERFIFLKIINILRILSVPLLSYIVLINGKGLIAITVVTAIVNIFILILALVYCKVKLKIKTTFGSISKELKKDIYIYSFFIFLSAIADKIYWQTDQILLGILMNAETVAIYAIAIQLVLIFASLSNAISSLFLPKLSQIVLDDKEFIQVNKIFLDVSKYQYVIVTLAFSGFILFGKEFIFLWVGPEYSKAYYIVLIIMIPFFIDLIQNLALMVMQARGLYYFRAILLLICATLNIIISVPIINHYGMYGTAVTTSIFIFLGNVLILNVYFHKKLNLNMFIYWKSIISYSLPISLLLLISYMLKDRYFNMFNLQGLIVGVVIYTLLYVLFIWVFVFKRFKTKVIKNL